MYSHCNAICQLSSYTSFNKFSKVYIVAYRFLTSKFCYRGVDCSVNESIRTCVLTCTLCISIMSIRFPSFSCTGGVCHRALVISPISSTIWLFPMAVCDHLFIVCHTFPGCWIVLNTDETGTVCVGVTVVAAVGKLMLGIFSSFN